MSKHRVVITINEFEKIQEQKKLGLKVPRVSKNLNISENAIRKVWNMNMADFKDYLDNQRRYLDKYRDFILDIICSTPRIKDKAVLYQCQEYFPEFKASSSNFSKYVKELRKQYDLERFTKESTSLRSDPLPGEEMQIDFGETTMKDCYGKRRKVYFYVMVLRYSQVKFVVFAAKPFNTALAIEAHKLAFRFFGGIAKFLVYDQDKKYISGEDCGELNLVDEFKDFSKEYNLSIVMCGGFHPQSKGTVENYVKEVKDGFIAGRVYHGINSLNSSCLEWLDNSANSELHRTKGIMKHLLYLDERKELRKLELHEYLRRSSLYRVMHNHIYYKRSYYELPIGYEGLLVKVETDGDNLIISDNEKNQIIAVHTLSREVGSHIQLIDKEYVEGASECVVKRFFAEEPDGLLYLKKVYENNTRYYGSICFRLKAITKYYSKEELLSAIRFALEKEKYAMRYVAGYLSIKLGATRARKAFGKSYNVYKKLLLEVEGLL